MSERIIIEIAGRLTGKGRPRATRFGRVYTPAATIAAEGRISYVAQQAMDGREPVSGPVRVAIEIHAAVPSSWSRRRRADALAGLLLPTTKPDLDNQIKLLLDGLAGIVFGNDKQVVEITAGKSYAVAARTVVVVEPLDGPSP